MPAFIMPDFMIACATITVLVNNNSSKNIFAKDLAFKIFYTLLINNSVKFASKIYACFISVIIKNPNDTCITL